MVSFITLEYVYCCGLVPVRCWLRLGWQVRNTETGKFDCIRNEGGEDRYCIASDLNLTMHPFNYRLLLKSMIKLGECRCNGNIMSECSINSGVI